MIGVIKTGFWTMLGGVISIILVVVQGVGPCGPKSPFGAFILLCGIVAGAIGFLTVVVGFAWKRN
jgi:hypothetical protein